MLVPIKENHERVQKAAEEHLKSLQDLEEIVKMSEITKVDDLEAITAELVVCSLNASAKLSTTNFSFISPLKGCAF